VRLTDMMQQVVTAGTTPDAAAGWAALPGVPESVAAARRLVTRALAGCPRSDDLVLAVSELATNAIAWSASGQGGTFLVRVRRVTLWARVEVVDDGPALAGPAVPSPGTGSAQRSANGYGLLLVREVTDRCGTSFTGGRRASWAECTWTL
jgi:anti-sigma regulatory factor (Ser/Thr protein kinase)